MCSTRSGSKFPKCSGNCSIACIRKRLEENNKIVPEMVINSKALNTSSTVLTVVHRGGSQLLFLDSK